MKNDLATAIVAAITGVLLAYFISNMVISKLAKSTDKVKTVDSSVSADLADPDENVFNYKSLNPTVEVYVGNCTDINMYGECVEENTDQIEQDVVEDSSDTSNDSSGDNSSSSDNSSQNQGNR